LSPPPPKKIRFDSIFFRKKIISNFTIGKKRRINLHGNNQGERKKVPVRMRTNVDDDHFDLTSAPKLFFLAQLFGADK
jgi:hypothetical protein